MTERAPMAVRMLWAPVALVACAVAACVFIIVTQTSGTQPSALLELRGGDRLNMLAAVPGDPECISWRGCAGSYDKETMDVNNPDTAYPDLGQGQAMYGRFDNYPTAWDGSPAAQYVRQLYPGGFPAFAHEEPAVIVGGER